MGERGENESRKVLRLIEEKGRQSDFLEVSSEEKRRSPGGDRLRAQGTLAALGHAEDFHVIGTAIPEFKQNEVSGAKREIGRTNTAIVEDVFVEKPMKAVHGNAQHGCCFGFRKTIKLRLVVDQFHPPPADR